MRKNHQKGFTLIELLVVISIISLLSSVVVASLNTARAKARDALRQSDLKQISNAIELYKLDNEGNPPFFDKISSNEFDKIYINEPGNGTDGLSWDDLGQELSYYLEKIPLDPCGHSCPSADQDTYYQYMYIVEESGYGLFAQSIETDVGYYGLNLSSDPDLIDS